MSADCGDVGESSDQDAVPGPAAIDTATLHGWCRLDPFVVSVWRLRTILNAAVVTIIAGPVAYIGVVQDRPRLQRVAIAVLVLTFIVALAGLVTASWRYRRWRWRLDPGFFELESGVWKTTNERVPVDRIHTMTINQGPLLRRRSLFQVSLYAAGSTGLVILPAIVGSDVTELQHRLGFGR